MKSILTYKTKMRCLEHPIIHFVCQFLISGCYGNTKFFPTTQPSKTPICCTTGYGWLSDAMPVNNDCE